jgi:NAD(P)-dependent dehydrogenase (short-subunit alcohol dehydrogenase family)
MSKLQKILITGASSGFGLGTARALAEKGHTVYAGMRDIAGKNAQKAKDLAEWGVKGNYALHVLDLDVTNESSIEKAVNACIDKGGIDVLINNAGVGTWGIDEGYDVTQAQQVFDVNVFGAMRMNRAVVPHFRKAGKGIIVYISSGLGRFVLPFMAAYIASKFAIEGYAESVSVELAPLGIQSVIIEPGAFATNFLSNTLGPKRDVMQEYGATADMFKSFSEGFEEQAKSGGLGDPEEVVKTIIEEVESSETNRPLRRPVGAGILQMVSAINEVCDKVQDQLLTDFGLK